MSYLGDFKLGDTHYTKFTTVNTSGVPTTLSGTPVISIYPANSTTEITAGITLTADFDSRTGTNHVAMVLTTGNGYATATDYQIVITTGTVSGSSVVGYVVGEFSIENRVQNIASVPILNGAYPQLGITESGTATGISSTTLTLKGSGAAFGTNALASATLFAFGSTQGYWQSRAVISNTSGTSGVLTVDAFSVTPSGTVTYILMGTAPLSSSTVLPNNFTQIDGSAPAAVTLRKILTGTAGETMTYTHVGNTQGSRTGGVSGAVGSVTAPVIIDSGSVTQIQSASNVTAVVGVPVQPNGSGTQNMGGP